MGSTTTNVTFYKVYPFLPEKTEIEAVGGGKKKSISITLNDDGDISFSVTPDKLGSFKAELLAAVADCVEDKSIPRQVNLIEIGDVLGNINNINLNATIFSELWVPRIANRCLDPINKLGAYIPTPDDMKDLYFREMCNIFYVDHSIDWWIGDFFDENDIDDEVIIPNEDSIAERDIEILTTVSFAPILRDTNRILCIYRGNMIGNNIFHTIGLSAQNQQGNNVVAAPMGQQPPMIQGQPPRQGASIRR